MSGHIVPQKPPVIQGGQVSKTPLLVQLKVSRPNTRPRWHRVMVTDADPHRRLMAAVALQAVFDALWPDKYTNSFDQHSATEFLMSPIGDAMLRDFMGVPQ